MRRYTSTAQLVLEMAGAAAVVRGAFLLAAAAGFLVLGLLLLTLGNLPAASLDQSARADRSRVGR